MSRGDIETQTMGKKETKVQATLIINIFVDKSDNASGSGEFDICFGRVKSENFAILLLLLGPIHFQFKPHKSFWLNDGNERAASWKIAQTAERGWSEAEDEKAE